MDNLLVIVDRENMLDNHNKLSNKKIDNIATNILKLVKSAIFCGDKIVALLDDCDGQDDKSINFTNYIEKSQNFKIIDELKPFENDIMLIKNDNTPDLNFYRLKNVICQNHFVKITICGRFLGKSVLDLVKSLFDFKNSENLKFQLDVISDAIEIYDLQEQKDYILQEYNSSDSCKNIVRVLEEDYCAEISETNNRTTQLKVGAFVGKFLPPHTGHLSVIDKILSECDEAVIVISDNPANSKALCEQAHFPYFTAKERLEWLKKHYKNKNNISFYIIDESKINGKYSYKKYAELFKQCVGERVNFKYADESYRKLNEDAFPECEFVPIDRDIVPIHGTMIRETKNLEYVIDEAREDIASKLKEE